MRHTIVNITLVAVCIGASGCVTLTGPSDIQKQVAKEADVKLVKEMGVTVGPLGVLLASIVAGAAGINVARKHLNMQR